MDPRPKPRRAARPTPRARERVLMEMCRAATEARTPGDVFAALARHLVEVLPFDRAVYIEVHGEMASTKLLYAPDPRIAQVLPPPFRWAGSTAERSIVERLPDSFRFEPGGFPGVAGLLEVGLRTAAMAPVEVGHDLLGVFAISSRNEDLLGEEDMDLFSRASQLFGLAVENALAHEENARHAHRERELLEIANALTRYRNPEDMFPAMIQALRRLVSFDSSILFAVDEEWMRAIAAGAPDEWDASLYQRRRWADSSSREAIESRRPTRHLVADLPTAGRARMLQLGLNVVVHVPVMHGNEVRELLAISSRDATQLGPDVVSLVERAAQQFALALQNARAHAENRRLVQRERDLLEMSQVMTIHRDPQELLAHLLPSLGRLVHLEPDDLAALFEIDEGRLTLAAASAEEFRQGPAPKSFEWARLPLAPALRTGEARRMRMSEDWCPAAGELRRLGHQTALCLPLIVHGAPTGLFLLCSARRDAFAGEEEETLLRVSSKLGLGLEVGRGYREIQTRERRLALENSYLKEELSESGGTELVGIGPAMAAVRELVRKVARTDAAVLVRGESGTGKELVADAVHRMSGRAEQPLIKVNCAALPESLISSELFGHEKGAFTGAVSQRIGRFELARGGTVLLDEIGELSLEVQAKLLRVLQQGEFERVGSNRTLHTDARVIAATNRNLERAVAQGRFREDLFYRLNVFPIQIPSLRQRTEDILVLAYYFIHRISRRMGKSITRLSAASEAAMLGYAWPGNVRELQNLIERAVILCEGTELRVEPDSGMAESAGDAALPLQLAPQPASLADAERRHIELALRRAGGRVAGPSGAAALLGIKRTTLNSRMKKLGISRAGAAR